LLRQALIESIDLYYVLRNVQQKPAAWEVVERLRVVRDASQSLWDALGIEKSPDDILNKIGIFSGDVIESVRVPLIDAIDDWGKEHEPEYRRQFEVPQNLQIAGPHNIYAAERLRDAVGAIGVLLLCAETAIEKRSKEIRKGGPRRTMDYARVGFVATLALTYENAFGRLPTDTLGGPWFRFLGEVLQLAGVAQGQRTDDALRKLWRNVKKEMTRERATLRRKLS
jgi:hypothetical protein